MVHLRIVESRAFWSMEMLGLEGESDGERSDSAGVLTRMRSVELPSGSAVRRGSGRRRAAAGAKSVVESFF